MVYDGAALWLMMDARNNDQYVLCRFDLKQNAMKAFDQSRGLHGFALLGDRLFREPAVSGARERMITLPDGRSKVADPLSDHDFWMEKQP